MPASRNRSVVIVTAGNVLQMVVQFGLQLILAREFGASGPMDAYVAAVTIPIVLGGMIGVPLGAILIPSLSRAQAEDCEEAAQRMASQLGITFALVSLVIAGLIAWQSSAVVSLFFPGLPIGDADAAAKLMVILAWLFPANILTMFCQSFLNWRSSFVIPAVAGVLGPVATVGFVITTTDSLGIEAVAYGVTIGAALNVAVQLPFVRGIGWRSVSLRDLRGPLRLIGPLMLASIYLRVEPLVDRSLASSLDVGVISHLGYTSRLTNAILALTSGGLSVVAFPFLSAAAAKGRDSLAEEVAATLSILVVVLVPFVVALGVFSPEIIRDLFQRGAFVAADTNAVATLVRWSLGLIIGASIGEITSRAFYADHSVWPPVIIGAALLTLAIVMKWLLTPIYGAIALVGSSSVAYCLAAGVQLFWLRLRLGRAAFAGVLQAAWTSGLCAALACVAGGLVVNLPLPVPAIFGGLAGAVTYIAMMLLLPGRFSKMLSERYQTRLSSPD